MQYVKLAIITLTVIHRLLIIYENVHERKTTSSRTKSDRDSDA